MPAKLFIWLKSAEERLDRAWGYDFSTRRGRRRSLWHFLWIDHGILRTFWTNLHEIAPGAWRANQPSPRRIAKYQAMGIGTIINLRGAKKRSHFRFEKRSCRKLGIRLISFSMKARSLSKQKELLALLTAFEKIEGPFLIHCKSGADRAGLASALYLMHIRGAPASEAKQQLAFKYLHLKSTKTGILDHMLDAYEADNQQTGISIRDWIENQYDRDVLTQEFNELRGIT